LKGKNFRGDDEGNGKLQGSIRANTCSIDILMESNESFNKVSMSHSVLNRKRRRYKSVADARQLAIRPNASPRKPSQQGKEKRIGLETTSIALRFNTPELLHRRSAAIALANAGYTKESDDALENILTEFENLSF
jgi:hypothetical protein